MKPYNTQSPQQKKVPALRFGSLSSASRPLGSSPFFKAGGAGRMRRRASNLPFAMGEQKIQVHLQLPQAGRPPKAQQRPDPLPAHPPLCPYILQNEDGDLVGAVGCQAYDPAEGENPAAIYASVRMGLVLPFCGGCRHAAFCQTDTADPPAQARARTAPTHRSSKAAILSHNSEQGGLSLQ